MLRGLLGMSCLIVAGGCVALNSGFEEGAGGTEASDTGQSTAGESDPDPSVGGSSAVTTVTAGDTTTNPTMDPTTDPTMDPTHSGGSSDSDSVGSSGSSGGGSETSVGDSSETGDGRCPPGASAQVMQDAFLLECLKEGCADRNYGQTEEASLADGDVTGALLLALPISDAFADEIHVTLAFVGDGDLGATEFSIEAHAVNPPCAWEQGPHDGAELVGAQSGVTAAYCDGSPNNPIEWTAGSDETVWASLDPAWLSGELIYKAGDVVGGAVFVETIILERPVPGPTPDALVISSDVPGFQLLNVFASESFNAPFVDVYPACP